MTDKIEARFMIQIAGKPIENVAKALELVLNKLKEEKKNYKLLDSEIIEPELDEVTTLYSGLLEVLVRFDDVEKLMGFIVDYTPNSVEIESPETFKFDANVFTGILNDISSNLLKSAMQLRQAHATLHHLNNKLISIEKEKEKK